MFLLNAEALKSLTCMHSKQEQARRPYAQELLKLPLPGIENSFAYLQVVSIDGQATVGWNGDQAAQLLRGRTGSSVVVRLARRTEAVPGVPARPEPPLPKLEYKQVTMHMVPFCGEPGVQYL